MRSQTAAAAIQAAWKAVEYVSSGMVVGLGTGSTAAFAVDRIGALLKDGTLKDIIGVPTSVRTYEQVRSSSSWPCLDTKYISLFALGT
jgi:ribose 5-phosphate isomerase